VSEYWYSIPATILRQARPTSPFKGGKPWHQLPFSLMRRLGVVRVSEHRILLRNLLRYLYPNPEVRVDAPLNVEAVITEQPALRQYIIHFIACQPSRDIEGVSVRRRPNPMEERPLYRAQIHLQQRPQQAMGLSKRTQLAQKSKTSTRRQQSAIDNATWRPAPHLPERRTE
jgi:hypothetical protein